MQIKTTRDYRLFKTVTGNRLINKTNLKNLAKSIVKKNMLEVNPIIVNEEMEVIDGQHRLQICRENKLPVHYFILKGAGLEEIQALNNVNKRWNSMDYIKSHVAQGNINYKIFLDFIEEYNVSASVGLVFLKGNTGGKLHAMLKSGTLRITEEELDKANRVATLFFKIAPFVDGFHGRAEHLAHAVSKIVDHEKADELVEKFERLGKIKPQTHYVGYLREFERILNFRKEQKGKNLVRLF